MRPARYQLRFVTGVAISAATYGSGHYGDLTYGQEATDPISSLRYRLVPWPAGYLADPAWIYRAGDSYPSFKATVIGDDGPLNLAAAESAVLVLTPVDGGAPRQYELTISPPHWLARDWEPGDLNIPGAYRAGVVLTFSSTRRLSLPVDDRETFVITGDPAAALWDGARWDIDNWT